CFKTLCHLAREKSVCRPAIRQHLIKRRSNVSRSKNILSNIKGLKQMKHSELMDELDKRRNAAAGMGGERKLEKRRESGDLNAQERLDKLVDPGSFFEVGLLGASAFELDKDVTPRDGKIVGFGKIDGQH